MTLIRSLTEDDADAVVRLSRQLGYAITPSVQAAVIDEIADDAAFVAVDGGAVVGWVHAFRSVLLQTGPCAEIGGLVVDETRRGEGIGRSLVARVETWARSAGLEVVRVRSNITRERAHEFYEELGYEVEKTSFTFRKELT